jgi:hypothetical protein
MKEETESWIGKTRVKLQSPQGNKVDHIFPLQQQLPIADVQGTYSYDAKNAWSFVKRPGRKTVPTAQNQATRFDDEASKTSSNSQKGRKKLEEKKRENLHRHARNSFPMRVVTMIMIPERTRLEKNLKAKQANNECATKHNETEA